MSDLISALHMARRSMEVATESLSVASNNIANEKTPGYARQRLVVQPATAPGNTLRIGAGVEAVRVEGIRDQLIERRIKEEVSNKSGEEALYNRLRDVEVLFTDSADSGMLSAITDFFNSFHTLAQDPSSTTLREQVQTAAGNLARSFESRSDEFRRLQSDADRRVSDDIVAIRGLADRISALSGQIRSDEAGGKISNDMRDRRSELVRELSEIVDLQEFDSDNDYKVMVGGALLVFDGSVSPVTATAAPGGFVSLKIGSIDVSGTIRAGTMKTAADFRDTVITGYMDDLDQLAYEIEQQVNAIHNAGFNPAGATGIDFFEPLASSVDAARQLRLSAAVLADRANVVAAAQAAGSDNDAATAIGNLLSSPAFSGGSVVDQYRSLVFKIGNDTSGSESRLEQHQALLGQLQNRRDAVSAVSVDEETMKILQFQRSYQASANVVRVIDELIQTLLGLGR